MKVFGDPQTVKSMSSHLPLGKGWRALPSLLAAVSVALLAGCGGSSSNTPIIIPTLAPTLAPSQTPTPTPTASPSSTASPTATASPTPTPAVTPTPVPVAGTASVFAVDCTTQKAYVPMLFLGTDGNGEVAEIDLSVDPDVTDPRVATISTKIPDVPASAAADPIHGQILVSNDDEQQTGQMSVIKESDNSITSFPFPTGSAPSPTDGVIYDPNLNLSLVSMSDALFSCSGVSGSCTGTAMFNASTGAFTNFNELSATTNLALDLNTQTSLLTAIALAPTLNALDLPNNTACEFSDLNLTALNAEPDGVAVDPATGIWVIGNFDSSLATVLNLVDGTFSPPPACMLTEGGTLPNSVNFDTGTSALMPGAAINAATHQALLTAAYGAQVALLTLPSGPVRQLTSAMVSGVQGTVPNDPAGNPWGSATFPYAIVADSCHNLGYVLDFQRDFLVQIDLAQFQSNPAAISTALAGGHCAGTSTPFLCDNNKGVKFFPLPGVK